MQFPMVGRRQSGKGLSSQRCQLDEDLPSILRPTGPRHEAALFRTPDQFGCAVMPDDQSLGNVANGESLVIGRPDCEQHLMLARFKARRAGCVLTELLESSNGVSEVE